MTAEQPGDRPSTKRIHFDRHTPEYRHQFESITQEMHQQCPLAWTDTHGGHWVAAGNDEVFELARSAHVSSDRDPDGIRKGYKGITIPSMDSESMPRAGILEMDDPEHHQHRQILNPYLSPAAVKRWEPFIQEVVGASIDERIESGTIDFVDDLANIVPAVLTLAMLGIPLERWSVYCEPVHANIYTPPDSPDAARVHQKSEDMYVDLMSTVEAIGQHRRPGLIRALIDQRIDGESASQAEIIGMLGLLIGGGFDTTTALTAHALEWLSENPEERTRLSDERDDLLDPATEEFLRYFTPAPGDGRTISADCSVSGTDLKEGERLWLSWAMANRDPEVFPDPNTLRIDRSANRHYSFGLGTHRCIGSNVARTVFKTMLLGVLDRMPDYQCDPDTTVHYETIGIIQGMRHLPATFTPGPKLGPGLDATLANLQRICDEQQLAAVPARR
ncbi:UNVERIFIED_CONTAM: cytochrome P450 [Williamsia faeni]